MFASGVKRVALGIGLIVLNKYLPSVLLRDYKKLLSTGGVGLPLLGLKSVHVGFQSTNEERKTYYLMVGLGSFGIGLIALTARTLVYIYEH